MLLGDLLRDPGMGYGGGDVRPECEGSLKFELFSSKLALLGIGAARGVVDWLVCIEDDDDPTLSCVRSSCGPKRVIGGMSV